MNINIERREKKYRAWDKFQKKMIGVEYDKENIGLLPSCDRTGTTSYNSNGNITLINVSYNDYDLMEFIGQRDKNRKEIYELDTTKWREQLGDKSDSIKRNDYIFGLVTWNKEVCGFIVEQLTRGKWSNKIDGLSLEYDTEFYSEKGQEFLWEDLEVVGDRYQNPDLLKNSMLTEN